MFKIKFSFLGEGGVVVLIYILALVNILKMDLLQKLSEQRHYQHSLIKLIISHEFLKDKKEIGKVLLGKKFFIYV